MTIERRNAEQLNIRLLNIERVEDQMERMLNKLNTEQITLVGTKCRHSVIRQIVERI